MSNRLRPSHQLQRLRRLRVQRLRERARRQRARRDPATPQHSIEVRTADSALAPGASATFSRSGLARFSRQQRIRWITVPVLLALLLIGGLRVVRQRIDVENVVRQSILPELEKQFGGRVEIGRIESDYVSGVTLYDVVIGRDARLPTGALLQAKVVRLQLDLISLALRGQSNDPLQALGSVQLEAPQIYLERDARGRLNWQRYFKAAPGTGARWTGLVIARNGRIFLSDATIRSARGENLIADARGINGRVQFNGDSPTTFRITAVSTQFGKNAVVVRNIAMNGEAGADGQSFSLGANWPSAPATLLADYAFPKRDVIAQSGTVGGSVQIVWDAKLPRNANLLAAGNLVVLNVAGRTTALRNPADNTPFSVQNASGPIAFNNSTFTLRNVTARAFDIPLRIAGRVALASPVLPRPTFDLTLQSDGAPVARLMSLVRNTDLARRFSLQSGLARGSMRVAGDTRAPQISADFVLPAFVLREKSGASWRGSALRAQLNLAADGRSGNAVLRAPDFAIEQRDFGSARGQTLATAFTFSTSAKATRLGGTFSVSDLSARANGIRTASTAFSSTAMRGAMSISTGNGKTEFLADIVAPRYIVNSAENRALPLYASGEALRSRIRFASSTNATGRLLASVESRHVALKHARFGAGRAASLRGTIAWSGNSAPLRADLSLSDFVARPTRALLARYDGVLKNGTLRGDELRLTTSTSNVQRGAWSGEAVFSGIDAAAVRVAAIAPDAANRVRDLGSLSGRALFSELGSARPVVETSFRLTRATIENVALRDVRGRAFLSDSVLTLRDTTAQSEASTLVASATFDLRRGTSSFGLSAPRIALDEKTVNPILAQWGLSVDGTATGRLLVSGGNGTNRITAPTQIEFDLALPQTTVRTLGARGKPSVQLASRTQAAREALRVSGARLRGRGTLQMQGDGRWQWNGQAELLAAQLGVSGGATQWSRVEIPAWVAGSQLRDVRLIMRGSLSRNLSTIIPQINGTVEVASAQVPLPNRRRNFAWSDARAVFVAAADAWSVPRFTARAVDIGRAPSNALVPIKSGEISGHFAWRRSGLIAGQILAQGLDAVRLQKAFNEATGSSNGTSDNFNFTRGTAFARADIAGTLRQPRANVQMRLFNAALNINNQTLPIDAARADINLTSIDFQTVPIEDFVLWSRGGRLNASGSITRKIQYSGGRSNPVFALNLQTRLDGLQAGQALSLASLGQLRARGELDGLLSGDLHVGGTTTRPVVEGRAALRLAQAFGLDINEIGAQLRFENTAQGARLQLTEIAGTAEGSQVRGNLDFDQPANAWNLKLQANGAATDRLLRVASQSASRIADSKPGESSQQRAARLKALLDLPLRGTLNAAIDVSGTIQNTNAELAELSTKENASRGLSLQPRDGTIKISTDGLQWRGRDVGSLRADLALRDGIAQISDLALYRSTPSNDANDKPVAVVRVVGQVPLSTEVSGLDATISVDDERLSLVREALHEVQETLRQRGVSYANFDQLVARSRALPNNLEGQLAFKANLSGSWSDLNVAVDLAVRNPRAGNQILPALSAGAAFADGVITVRHMELRQTFAAAEGEEERETVLRVAQGGRIEPDGTIELDGEVLNANLSQLALWLPDLREISGRPLLRGELSLFTFQVRGTTSDPNVIGSIEAQDLIYRAYSLDRLRVTRFDIAEGQLNIEPGNLTIVKGGFQSSAAWGRVPWSWGAPGESLGPRRDAPIVVHLPLETHDFGALAGAFVPALANVDAKSFSGTIDISGTVENPRLAGEIAMQDARFRADPATLPFGFGVTELSGTMRFVDGNRLQIEGVRGRFVRSTDVRATATRNLPAEQRDTRAARRQARNPDAQPPRLAGEFALAGAVRLDLDPANFFSPLENLAAHNYDLALTLRNGEYSSEAAAGLRDISLDAGWKTGEGVPRRAQNVSWNFTAAGRDLRNTKKSSGQLRSVATVVLAPNFATGIDALLRSRFDGEITARALPFDLKSAARGLVNANLTLDNGTAPTPRTVPTTPTNIAETKPRASNIAFRSTQARPIRIAASESPQRNTPAAGRNIAPVQNESPAGTPRITVPNQVLRIAGTINLTDTEVRGAPLGNVGYAGIMPNGPLMDIRLTLGQNVRFVSPTLRAEFVGSLDVNGTPREPNIFGRVTTRDGQIRFPNATARITEGEVTVSVTRDLMSNAIRSRADIDATAVGQVDRYRITLALHGPLDFGSESTQNLRVDVTSDPPLSQDEAFAQLTGTSLRQLEIDKNGNPLENPDVDRVNQVYARAIVGLLSAPLFAGIERTLEEVLGINSITLDYRFNEPLSVQFGKAIGDRIYVTYRRSLSSNQPGQPPAYNLRVDYRIKGGLLLGVQTDERGRRQITLEKTFRF